MMKCLCEWIDAYYLEQSQSLDLVNWTFDKKADNNIEKGVVFDTSESNAVSKTAPFFGFVTFTYLVIQTILQMDTEWYWSLVIGLWILFVEGYFLCNWSVELQH